MSAWGKQDNDHVASKVGLRVEAVALLGEPRRIQVLDAYHGHGRLWGLTQAALPDGWDVHIFGSDKEARAAGTLRVDNLRLLQSLDLTRFDLIDLDAYGWPAAQLKVVAAKAPNTIVLSTRIAPPLGQIPNVILADLGIDMPDGAPHTLVNRLADELWEAWCWHLGYRTSLLCQFNAGFRKRYEVLIPAGFTSPEVSPVLLH